MRVLVRLMVGAVLLVLALLVLAFVAVGNEAMSAWLVREGARAVPGELRLENLSGDLVSGMSAAELHYQSDSVLVDATDARVAVRWAELLAWRLTISQLSAATVTVGLLPSEAESDGFELPEIDLPLAIGVDEATVGRLAIDAGGTEEVIQDLSLRAGLAGSALRVEVVEAVARGFRVELSGHATLRGAYPLRAAVEWEQLDGPLSGAGDFAGDLVALAFTHELRLPDAVQVQGTVRHLITAPRLQLDANWEQVAWPLEDFGEVVSRDGRVEVDGDFAAYRLDFNAGLQSPGVPDLMIELTAHGQETQVDIDAFRVLGMGGELTGSGRFDVAGPSIAMRVSGSGLDPSYLRADLRGDLDFDADIEGNLPDQVLVRAERLSGELLGQSVAGSGEIVAGLERLELRQVKIRSGENRLSFDGTVRPALSGEFAVDAPALDLLWPGLGGRVAGEGSVSGALDAPVVSVELEGSGLVFQAQSVESLRLAGEIDAARRLDWTLEADGLRSGQSLLGRLAAEATGELAAHRIRVGLTDGPVAVKLESSGGWDGSALRHVVNDGNIEAGAAGSWNLRAPVAVSVEQDRAALDAHCWEGSLGLLCIEQSSFSDERIATAVRLTDFPLSMLARFAGEGVEVYGTADADLTIEREGAGLTARLSWDQSDTRIVYRESERSTIESEFSEVRFLVDATEAVANLDARVRGDYGLEVDAAGTLREPLSGTGELDVRLTMRVPELGESTPLLTRFLPLSSLAGALNGDLHITGTRDAPTIEGEARLTDGFASVPQAGIDVEDVDLAIVGRDREPLAITGSARSGEGHIDISGELQWSEAAGAFAELAVTGQDFQVIRFPDQTVQISPDVRARIDDERVEVAGRIEVPRARIVIEALPETASARSADIVVHDSVETVPRERRAPYQLFGDLEVSLGQDVYFGGFGIETRLAGGLKLSRAADAEAASAEGGLRTVDGKFGAYGKELTIERGSLIFAGPIDDPNVDARATRIIRYQGEDITAGVLLSGPLSNMRTRVFSEPSMSEADALSFLVLDRPISRAEGDDAELVSGAAVAMGVAQALPITQSLQDTTGLDEVGFEKSEDDDTAVVAGKRLSEDVYVRYTYGLFNRVGTFFVRYRIGGGFEIEAGSGQEQTLDLIYSIDR